MIFYKSKYGYSRRYAECLSEMTGIPAVELKKETIHKDPRPVLILGAYAGGLNGVRLAREVLFQASSRPVVCICGLSDPKDPATVEAGRQSLIQSGLGDKNTPLFFLRGGIDYSKLSRLHAVMMWMLYMKMKGEKKFEESGFLETYGKKVDFFDPEWLKPVIEILNED